MKKAGARPALERQGRVEGTGELMVAALPFIWIYHMRQDAAEIAAVAHGAQR
jgi:hypothetical protein